MARRRFENPVVELNKVDVVIVEVAQRACRRKLPARNFYKGLAGSCASIADRQSQIGGLEVARRQILFCIRAL